MKLSKINIYITLFASILIFSACSDDFLDVNQDPNVASAGELNFLMASAQANIGGEFSTGLGFGGAVYARQYYGLGTSTYAITGATYQADWNSLYSGGLKDLREIILAAESEDKENFGYQGVAKVLSAYVFHQLVDYFGDIPYTEALQGEVTVGPAFDTDSEVYDLILASLDEAIANLEEGITRGDIVGGDAMFDGDLDAWIAAANTLKLKMYLNIANVDETTAAAGINDIITDGRLIDEVDGSEDWQLNFTDSQTPNGRHPFYNSEYSTSPGYLDNFIMLTMLQNADPRIRYYFYRQATYGELDFQTTPCSSRSDCATWDALFALNEDYIGRDHGDPSGLPGDDNLVTVPGVYPFGGKYDNDTYNTVNANSTSAGNRGAEGAGFMPLFTASMTHFMLAEAALNVAGVTTPSTAVTHFENGMQASFDKVRNFSTASIEGGNISTYETAEGIDYDADATTYINDNVANFNAGTTADQFELVMRQKNIANWGNGMESYTDLRRTGRPNNLPASLAPQGPFPARVLYPDSEIASNPNAPDEVIPQSTPVFWDN